MKEKKVNLEFFCYGYLFLHRSCNEIKIFFFFIALIQILYIRDEI